MNDPHRVVWVGMIVGGIVTAATLTTGDASKRTPTATVDHRTSLWRVGLAWPLATFGLLAAAEVAPPVAAGLASTYALSAMLGGKAFVDFLNRLLSGQAVRPAA